jgi:hypothetical protein
MSSPNSKRQLKAERTFNVHASVAAAGARHAKPKAVRGLSADADQPASPDTAARQLRARPWSKPEAPAD